MYLLAKSSSIIKRDFFLFQGLTVSCSHQQLTSTKSTSVGPEEVRTASGDLSRHPGTGNAPFTEQLTFLKAAEMQPIPIYRVMDNSGNVIDPAQDPQVD